MEEKIEKQTGSFPVPQKLTERVILTLTKPSYVLGLGSRNIRTENCARLEKILRKLVLNHNWKEASGVLSMLLEGTCKNTCSAVQNREKYKLALEILQHIEGKNKNSTMIKRIYEVWMKKSGSKDILDVFVDYIIFYLQQGNLKEAHDAAVCLAQEREFPKDSYSNMIVGLTYFELWYSGIPKEMQLRDLEGTSTLNSCPQSNIPENSNASYATYGHNYDPSCASSQTSVRNDKIILEEDSLNPDNCLSVEVRETIPQSFHQTNFYMNPEDSDNENASSDNVEQNELFSAHVGMESWLLPLKFSGTDKNVEVFNYTQKEILNDYYKSAVNYLQLALDLTPPELSALHPLIQLLMIGNRIKEALDLLEKICHETKMLNAYKFRAGILERFDRSNLSLISSCYESVLEKDPACNSSLNKLVAMHQNGDYSTESLLEMIALSLDAKYGDSSRWKDFAWCFYKLCHQEEDRMSVYVNGNNEGGSKKSYSVSYNRIPQVFTKFESGESWNSRCECWLTRHFSQDMLLSEIEAGDFELLTYKAACACHLYGNQLGYVMRVFGCLEKENKDLFLILQTHRQESVGFYLDATW